MPYFGVPIRNGLPIGLGSQAGFGIAPFDPRDLFSAGEQGAWYDPSDLTTLFTDSAGTTPVTAVEQFVGRMNDKSGRGNHATSTGTKRPKLAARYNLLTYTEQFDNAVWGNANATVVPNVAVAPNGTTTADLIYPTTTGNFRDKTQQFISGASALYTASVYMKAAGFRWGYLRNIVASNVAAWFDLQNGVVGTIAAGYTASIQNVGDGWYRCSIANTSALFGPFCVPGLSDADNTPTATVNGTNGILVWGADLRPTSQATGLIGPTYQRVVDAATYDAVGFLPYLQFDGIDDSMSHTFGVNADATYMAGARRLGGALEQGLFAATPPSTRSIGLLTANAVNPNWGTYAASAFQSSGKSLLNNTAVITNVCEPSLPSQKLYTNNALDATITGALYAGDAYERRVIGEDGVGLSRFFFGYVYGIIAVDKALSNAQREATVAWLAQKSGVSL